MKLKLALIAAASILATQAMAAAPSAQDLLKKNNCLTCHATDKKVVGPSYKDVAAKYKGKKDAQDMLVAKVKKGGAGVWGSVQMPANASVPDADLRTMVKYILSLK